MVETKTNPEPIFNLQEGKYGKVAIGRHGNTCLAILPHQILDHPDGYEIYLTGNDKQGNPDFSQIINSAVIDGNPEDLEEIAYTYMLRLQAGTKPQDMFRDIEEANQKKAIDSLKQLK